LYYKNSDNNKPEVVLKLIKNIEDFEKEVKRVSKKNIMKRVWNFSKNSDKLDAVNNKIC